MGKKTFLTIPFALLLGFFSIEVAADTDAVNNAREMYQYKILQRSLIEANCQGSGVGSMECGTPENPPLPTARPSNTPKKTSPSQQGDPARERAEQAVASCESSAAAIDGNSCSTDASNPAMADAYNSVSNNSGSSTSGTTDTCGKPGGSSSQASQAIANVRSSCQSAYNTCSRACSAANSSGASNYSDLSARLGRAQARCENATNKMAGMDAGAAHASSNAGQSEDCQKDVNDREANNNLNNDEIKDRSGCSDPAYAAQNSAVCGGVTAPPFPVTNTNHRSTEITESESESWGGSNGSDGVSSAAVGRGPEESVNDDRGFDNAGATPNRSSSDAGFEAKNGGPSVSKNGGKDPKAIDDKIKFGATVSGGRFATKNTGSYKANGSWIPDKVGVKGKGGVDPNMDRFRPEMLMRGPASGDGLDARMWAARKSWQVIWDGPNDAHNLVMKSPIPLNISP